jgi:hypothetical protein
MAKDSSSEIEKKKKQMLSSVGTSTTTNDPLGYATTLFRQLFIFGIMIVIGTTMVYSGKVAQANILPTKIKCFPYTNLTPTIDKVVIDINIVKVKPDEVSKRWLRDMFDTKGSLGYNNFLREIYTCEPKRLSLKSKDETTSLEFDLGKIIDTNGVSKILSESKDILCEGRALNLLIV